jgi:hypothetical protein
MKKESISISDKLFIACELTRLIGQPPSSITTCGTALMFTPFYGEVLVNFEKRKMTIDAFVWDEELAHNFLLFTHANDFNWVVSSPDGEWRSLTEEAESDLCYCPKCKSERNKHN